MACQVDQCLDGLKADKHLDRERALQKFQELISHAGEPASGGLLTKGCTTAVAWHCLMQQQKQYRQLPGTADNNGAPAGTSADQNVLFDGVKGLLTSATWEHKIGGLMAAKVGGTVPQQFRRDSVP